MDEQPGNETTDDGSAQGPIHVSVLMAEVLTLLAPAPGQTIVDATCGAGGHARALAGRVLPDGRVVALDLDPMMLELARSQSAELPVVYCLGPFDELQEQLRQQAIERVDAVLADLGFCSDQMADAARGLSFQVDGPLDMRLGPSVGETAADLVNRLSERDLADVIYQFGEERFSRRIARRLVEERRREPIRTTGRLAEVVRRCVPRAKGKRYIDPATRTFQALRIAVNDELGRLERLLEALPQVLKPGGRAAIISFHSLEDRMVEQEFRRKEKWAELTRKPVQASDDEAARNPRARSAKLRAAVLRDSGS